MDEAAHLSTAEACRCRLRLLADQPVTKDWFDWCAPIAVTRAPGRLDLMGGFADYSGSLVLQRTISESAMVAVQPSDDGIVRVLSLPVDADGATRNYTVPADRLKEAASGPPEQIASVMGVQDDLHWASYIAGVFPILMRDAGLFMSSGCRVLVESRVPEGKGVSSSAAIEVATMSAISAAYKLDVSAKKMAQLCQLVEHQIAGAPCGIMDQMAVTFGEKDKLMSLLCRPAELVGQVEVPTGLDVWALDSGERHAIAGADYGTVRTAAFMGHRILVDQLGLNVDTTESGTVLVENDPWGGYLCNIEVLDYEMKLKPVLPETMKGDEFIERYGGTIDPVSRVCPETDYAVDVCTSHPIYQMARVREFCRLLESPLNQQEKERLGQLMFETHDGYVSCGLASPRTTQVVEWVRTLGLDAGLYGAKITGGGSGGSVAVLSCVSSEDGFRAVTRLFHETYGFEPYVFRGSSNGAEIVHPS